VRVELRGVLTRVGGFAGLSLAGAIAPFLVLPVAARLSSEQEWAAIALGQSVGGLLAIFVSLGWNLTGPSLVALTHPDDRADLYIESLLSRGFALVVGVPVASVVSSLLAPADQAPLAVATSLAMLSAGIGIEWYCVGVGSWLDMAKFDLFPRFVSSAIAVAVLLATGEVIFYPVLVGAGSLVGVAAFTVRQFDDVEVRQHLALARLLVALRRSGPAFLTEVAGATYSTGSVALVSASTNFSEVAMYSSGDRLYRLSLQSIVALSRALQGWVVTATGVNRNRVAVALGAYGALGLLGGATLGIVGPWASRLLFGERLGVDTATALAFGIAFMAIACNTALGRLLLVPSGNVRAVMASTFVGAAVGVPTVVAGSHVWGASGGAGGLAFSQAVVCLWQLPASMDAWRRVSRSEVPPGPPRHRQ
jgi:O-antigen/teichoic acid export membrane protein